jgi:hypothetical protein
MRFHRLVFASLVPTIALACGGKTDGTPTDDTGSDSAVAETTPPDSTPLPDTSTPDTPPPRPSDKVDLLLVVDNSQSMSDKQSELAKRVPELVSALTNPPAGGRKAVSDLHVGVITSSLGSHGTSACDPAGTTGHPDDHGHLLPRGDATCAGTATASALTWVFDPAAVGTFKGIAGVTAMQTATSCVIASVGEGGCGYEETLESMYHFLVEPSPYLTANAKCTFGSPSDACGGNIELSGVDTELLAQRKAFLRPDSVLQIVIVTDENDFSLHPTAVNWVPWAYGAGLMQRGWKACETVPDDFEPDLPGPDGLELHTRYNCFSCFENTADPDGNCTVRWPKGEVNSDGDDRNLRGFHQVQRFGYNFLWSRQRYVDGLTSSIVDSIDPSTGRAVRVPNPLFAAGRSPANVFVAVVVGVPPFLVSDAAGNLETLSEADWDKITSADLSKRDPHMIESIAPRTAYGLPKFAGDRAIDPVSGGERDLTYGDLQYACIGPRASDAPTGDCTGPSAAAVNPLCDAAGKQPYYKAYPGLRHLRVVRALGANGLVGSICSSSFSPIMTAIADKLQPALVGR